MRDASRNSGAILGMNTKTKRIRWHDQIRDFIVDKLPKAFSTFVELVGGDLKKPDLMMKVQEKLMMVVDVTVRYENKMSLLRED